MSKKGISVISGNISPIAGEKYTYHIVDWYKDTPIAERNPKNVIWELFRKRKNGKFTTTNIKKKGDSNFTFGEASIGNTYRLEGYLHQPEGGGLVITPKQSSTPKINKVELFYVDDTKGSTFSFKEKLRARAYCGNMFNKELVFTLWEDDAKNSGHDPNNKPIDTKKAKVDKNGIAVTEFVLTQALMKKALQGETDVKQLEFYVTVEYYKNKKHASNNESVNNPFPQQKPQTTAATSVKPKEIPKAKGSPAEQKPASKKEEKGIIDFFEGLLWDHAETKGTAKQVQEPAKQKSNEISTTQVKKLPKEKFDKVVGLGKEAVFYISSEIATEIKVDKEDKIVSYPDSGGYNGMKEYKEGNNLYCKKISTQKSAYPLYKMYIYRGSKIGEAVKKLKQDLENKTHENAESTILTVARHAQTNNKDYGKSGPLPPNSIGKLYRIRYMQARNHANKESFRYRIVDDNTSNLKPLNDFAKEVSSGAMTLGSRGSISLDPWNSNGLIGCVGIRNSDGKTHPSCEKEYPHQDSVNYKFIYHALNNYLESIVPELTGVYGRRGYSSNGKVAVAASKYKEEVKVFVLADPLPEISSCKLNLKKDGRQEFYEEFGESAIKMVENQGKSNKFKGLYIVSQRRQENSFKLKVPNNNPMNIKDSGDLGKSDLYTREVFNGKEVYINDSFGNFSTVEKGFEGYLKLLNRNFNDAYNAILDDSKTIDDFLSGMQDTGKKGAYATDPNYKTGIKGIFVGVVKDYKEILSYRLCKEKAEEGKAKIKKDIELLNKLK